MPVVSDRARYSAMMPSEKRTTPEKKQITTMSEVYPCTGI
jgi:hypothetical protein